MTHVLEQVLGQPAWVVYLVVGLVVFAEDALFVGFVVPGETAAILGGVSAALGTTSLAWMGVVVVLAAVVGDSVGFEVGRRFGPRVLRTRVMRRAGRQVDAARDVLDRRGPAAVFLARWTAFLRATVPTLAGTSGLAYPRFLLWNGLGGLLWGLTCVVGGFLAGHSFARLETWLGRGSFAVVGVIVLGAVLLHLRRRRQQHEPA